MINQDGGTKIPITHSLGLEYLRGAWREMAELRLPTMVEPMARHRTVRDLYIMQQVYATRNRNPTQTNRTSYGGPMQTPAFGEVANRLGQYNPEVLPIEVIEQMDRHPMVALGMGLLRGLVEAGKWYIDCSNPVLKAFLEKAIGDVYDDIIRPLSNALKYGCTSCELVYRLDDDYPVEITTRKGTQRIVRRSAFVLKTIKDHWPGSIRVVTDQTGDLYGIRQYQPDGHDVLLKRGFKLMFGGFGQDHGNWFGTSRYIPANQAWYWGTVVETFMLRYLERQGSGNIVVRHPVGQWLKDDGTYEDAAEFALDIGTGMIDHTVAAVPSEFDGEGNPLWDIKYLESAGRAAQWERVLNHYDIRIIRGLCIPDKAIMQDLMSTGGAAGTEASQNLMLMNLAGVFRSIAHTINRDIVVPLKVANFLPREQARAEFKFHDPEFDRRTILKQILQEWIRQWPNFMAAGKFPRKVPALVETSRILGIPIEDSKDIFEDAATGVVDEAKAKDASKRELPVGTPAASKRARGKQRAQAGNAEKKLRAQREGVEVVDEEAAK